MTAVSLLTLCAMVTIWLNPNTNVNAQTTGIINRSFMLPNGTIFSLSINTTWGPSVSAAKATVYANCKNLFPSATAMYWYDANTGKVYQDKDLIINTSDPITIEYNYYFYRYNLQPVIKYTVNVTDKTSWTELRDKIKTAVNVAGFNPTNLTLNTSPQKIIVFGINTGTLGSLIFVPPGLPVGYVN